MERKPDFSGWATRNNLLCSDGRVILKDAFKDCDGKTVPLVWNHQHDDPNNVLGHALLRNEEDGVMADCFLNDTESGKAAKIIVEHGDVAELSIYANQLKQKGRDVMHGIIREVSLVLAGANPGAKIDPWSFAHDDSDTILDAVIYSGEELVRNELAHSDEEEVEEKTEELAHADEENQEEDKEETVEDVFNTLSEKQKTVVYALIGQALEDGGEDEEDEEDTKVKHNVFENETKDKGTYLSHADEKAILTAAKNPGFTFQSALKQYMEDNDLQHDAISSGFSQEGTPPNVSLLFPEYKDVRPGAPELITSDQGWIGTVMGKVHKSPISRIRTGQVDIRNIDALRAKGYVKGKQKGQTGNFELVRRTTDPQTVYVKSALHRDDIIDITDFDYVQYLYNIDRMQLNEELATAIMIGDGRSDASDDKIRPEHIRPIWTDDDLYTIHYDIDLDAMGEELQGEETASFFGENYVMAEAMVNACLYSRETYKGSGTPDMFITPHMLNVMLLARDRNGRRIYSSKAELASALNVGNIYTAEQFVNKTRTSGSGGAARTKKLLALIVNLSDYSLGATKGGEITHFTQFDIDFNQQKSLLETRCSGALTRCYSAIAIEQDVTNA